MKNTSQLSFGPQSPGLIAQMDIFGKKINGEPPMLPAFNS